MFLIASPRPPPKPDRASESARALRDIVAAEAERWLGMPLWLDPFATAVDALVPWFFWRFPEPLAEGADALARPVWGRSRFPGCIGSALSRFRLGRCCWRWSRRRGRTGCAASSSPRSRLPNRRGWRKLTVVAGQQDRCLILPYKAAYGGAGRRITPGHA
jgi:hypothetical protein